MGDEMEVLLPAAPECDWRSRRFKANEWMAGKTWLVVKVWFGLDVPRSSLWAPLSELPLPTSWLLNVTLSQSRFGCGSRQV